MRKPQITLIIPPRPPAGLGRQRVQLLHIPALQPAQVNVLPYSPLIRALGHHRSPPLHRPRNQDLSHRFPVLFRQGDKQRVVPEFGGEVLAEGPVGLADDVVGFAEFDEGVLRVVRVEFDLRLMGVFRNHNQSVR